MDDPPEEQDQVKAAEAREPQRRRHFSMLRSFALADFITLANAAAGMGSILLCLRYVADQDRSVMWAAICLFPVALLCDVLDGSVARWRRRSSALGADLDSLADVVSFGVAPAVLGHTLGLNGGWDAIVLVFFVTCGISRLARFNVTAASLTTDKGKVSHFEGTPIPTSLLLVAVLAAAFATGSVHEELWFGVYQLGPWAIHPLVVVYALSGSAMISGTLKIPKP
jgi:CDP-diacylglycerol--serine O-phosphatidyltransferase